MKSLKVDQEELTDLIMLLRRLNPKPGAHMAVNVRNFDPGELEELRIRRFDGAVTWKYLDE